MDGSEKAKMKYGELKTETQYLKKLAADLVSRFGDSLDAIAYSWMVYALTGSASLTAVTFAVNTLVSVILSPFAAALITGWNKKTIIVVCDIGRGALVTMTALLFFTGILQPWMVIAVTGLNSTLEAFRNPAGMAIFPQIVTKEKYTLAISLSGALSRAAELVGMALAGVIVSLLGVTGALLIDAGAFFLSAVILATLKLPPHVKEAAKNAFSEFVSNTKEGFAYAVKNKVVIAVCCTACFLNFTLTPLSALQAAYVNESLHLTAEALSVIGVSLSIGMGIASLFVPKLLGKISRFSLLFIGILAVSVSFISLAFIPYLSYIWIWISLVLVFLLMGVGSAFSNTVIQVSFMEKIEEQYLARMNGIMSSLCLAAMPVASFLSAALAKTISIPYILLIFGVLAILGTICSLFIKPLRQL